jgi:glycosyltransferase involved in cell wall biosynthesis
MKKRVLHLVEYLYLGGIERLLEQLAIHSNDHTELHFFTYETTELKGIGKEIRDRGFPVTIYKKSAGRDWRLVSKLIDYIKEHKIEAVHTHDFGPIEYAVILKLRFPFLRLIHTQHTMHHFVVHNHYRWFFQFASYFYTSIIGVSQFVVDGIIKDCPLTNRFALTVIYNGVDIDLFKNTDKELDRNNKLKLVAVARISNEKNLLYLFNTCRLLKEANIPFEFHHAGTGKTEQIINVLKVYIKDHNLENEIIMHGFCNDAKSILDLGDIFLSSSKREGHPVALIEAMSCEKLCLCSDIPPHRETLEDTRYLYDVEDEFALFNKLKAHYQVNAKARKYPELRNLVIKNYSIDKMVINYENVY